MVHKFFYKKTLVGAVKVKLCWTKKLAKKLHKPIIKRNEKRKVHSFFMEDIYKDLADMEFISKFEFDKGFQVFIDIYSKYTWDVPFED